MSWEDQGRQFHQWFGHGTAGGVDAGTGAGRTGDVAGAVGNAAVAALGGERGRGLARVLAEGGAEDLAAALPIWAASAGLAAGRFRALVVGPGFGAEGAASLQAMARIVAQSGADGDASNGAKEAGAHLAAALGGQGQAEWGYKLNYARDMAEYAAERGIVPTGQEQSVTGHEDVVGSRTLAENDPGKPVQPSKATRLSQLAVLPDLSSRAANEQPAPMLPGDTPSDQVPPGYDAVADDFGRIIGYQRHEITVVQGYVGGAAAAFLLAGPALVGLTRVAVPGTAAEVDAATLAAAKAAARSQAAVLRSTFGRSVEGAQRVLAEIEAGTFRPPAGLTKKLLNDYELAARAIISEAAASGKQAALTNLLQGLRLEIIAKIRGML